MFSVTFTLYCTMMPRFSFCVGSCISVLEARLVSSCFSWPSSAAVRGWYQLIDLPTEWPPYLDPTYLCYWREEASTRTLYSGWTQSRGGTHPQTPLKAQIELISHCSLQKLESLSLFTFSSTVHLYWAVENRQMSANCLTDTFIFFTALLELFWKGNI